MCLHIFKSDVVTCTHMCRWQWLIYGLRRRLLAVGKFTVVCSAVCGQRRCNLISSHLTSFSRRVIEQLLSYIDAFQPLNAMCCKAVHVHGPRPTAISQVYFLTVTRPLPSPAVLAPETSLRICMLSQFNTKCTSRPCFRLQLSLIHI